jgi:hypothetical protein
MEGNKMMSMRRIVTATGIITLLWLFAVSAVYGIIQLLLRFLG